MTPQEPARTISQQLAYNTEEMLKINNWLRSILSTLEFKLMAIAWSEPEEELEDHLNNISISNQINTQNKTIKDMVVNLERINKIISEL